MDLTIDDTIILDSGYGVDPHDQQSIDASFGATLHLPVVIPSMTRFLASTKYAVRIADDKLGLICLRSTWARLGLIAPPTVADPGFQGYLTMELFNTNRGSIVIALDDLLWHMVLLPTEEPVYAGRYQFQGSGVGLPKAL